MKFYQALLVTVVAIFAAAPAFACDPPCYTVRCVQVRPACPPPVIYVPVYPRPAYTVTTVSSKVSVSSTTRTYYGYGGYSTSTSTSVSASTRVTTTTVRR